MEKTLEERLKYQIERTIEWQLKCSAAWSAMRNIKDLLSKYRYNSGSTTNVALEAIQEIDKTLVKMIDETFEFIALAHKIKSIDELINKDEQT